MAGMLLSGASPIYAAIYQFVIISMIQRSSCAYFGEDSATDRSRKRICAHNKTDTARP